MERVTVVSRCHVYPQTFIKMSVMSQWSGTGLRIETDMKEFLGVDKLFERFLQKNNQWDNVVDSFVHSIPDRGEPIEPILADSIPKNDSVSPTILRMERASRYVWFACDKKLSILKGMQAWPSS